MTSQSAKSRLLSDPKVRTATEAARAAQTAYVAALDPLLPIMDTSREAEALRQVIKTEKDATLLAKAAEKLDALTTDAAKLASERARVLATEHLQTFSASVKSLLAVAATAADALIVEARESEKSFLLTWGLPATTDGEVVRTAKAIKLGVGHQSELLNRELNGFGAMTVRPRLNTMGSILSYFS